MVADYVTQRRQGRRTKNKRETPKQVNVATVNRELCCLKTIFRKALDWGQAEENPTDTVKTHKETPKVPRLLEPKEIENFLQVLPEHLRALGACALYAGFRRSELFHLRWEDVNWKTGEIAVVSRSDHHTKNYESRRIPMNAELSEALGRHPRRLGSPHVLLIVGGNRTIT